MIKEFAFGLAKRHYFQDASELSSWQKLANDTYTSLYDYDEYVAEYFAKQFRTQIINNDIRLRIIPISKLEEVKLQND